MPDFQFSDENSPPQPLPTPPPTGAPEVTEGLPAKPSGFQFTEDSKPTPQVPVGPAPPVMPPAPPAAAPPGTPPTSASARPQGQTQSPPASGPRPLQPRPNPVNRPASTAATPSAVGPGPNIALPIETVGARPAANDREGAPQDNFSFKLWSMGQSLKQVMEVLEGPASWILRVAMVVGVTALAYVLAGTILGNAGNLQGNPNAAALVKNLTLASQILMISLLGIGIASIILGYEDNRIGLAVGAVGVLCHFVVPIILKKSVGDSAATAGMAPFFRHYGYILVMIGLAKGLCDIAVWLWGLPDKIKQKHANVGVSNQAEAKQRIIAREANFMSPCWKLPFCRESIRKQCPAFLAKKTCWKFGRGCYCDEEMISRIVRGEALDVIKSPTRQSRQGKPPCGRCYIYLEHQTYKFRVWSPLALPAAVLATWAIWPFYEKVFTVGNKAFDSIWNTLSFNSSKLTPDALETSKDSIKEIANLGNRPEDVALIAQNMLGVLLGFMLLIYISKFIEWAIFKAKW